MLNLPLGKTTKWRAFVHLHIAGDQTWSILVLSTFISLHASIGECNCQTWDQQGPMGRAVSVHYATLPEPRADTERSKEADLCYWLRGSKCVCVASCLCRLGCCFWALWWIQLLYRFVHTTIGWPNINSSPKMRTHCIARYVFVPKALEFYCS